MTENALRAPAASPEAADPRLRTYRMRGYAANVVVAERDDRVIQDGTAGEWLRAEDVRAVLEAFANRESRTQPTCSTCVHLTPFELAPELNTCPVVNIRIHTESAAIFGCNQHESKALRAGAAQPDARGWQPMETAPKDHRPAQRRKGNDERTVGM